MPELSSLVLVVLALALLGIVVGQMIRQVRALAEDYARRLQSVKEKAVV